MKILVCVRQGLDGEINPFDACAYEEALRIKDAEVILISMGPQSTKDFLLRLSRLGAKKAILLSDSTFAGADTLATAYTLSLAVKKIKPDLIFCGRQTFVGDTAQTGVMLSVFAQTSLITNVMSIDEIGEKITCTTRQENKQTVSLPALLTIERINNLRFPSLMSKVGEIEVLTAKDLGADNTRCGLLGSPTRVLETFENKSGKRKCKFILPNELLDVISESVKNFSSEILEGNTCNSYLKNVCIVGKAPLEYAKTVSDDITELELTDAYALAEKIRKLSPSAVIWASDYRSKRISAQVAAMLNVGLCADCTMLKTDGQKLYMYRPALSSSVIAKIESRVKPAMATVRTTNDCKDIVVCAGYGAKDRVSEIKEFAQKIGAELVATRKMVDNDILPYSMQVGLTGKVVSAPVYIAVGVSGAVQHIVGMQRSGTIIAINPDKDAPIFDYADYGIIGSFDELKEKIFTDANSILK